MCDGDYSNVNEIDRCTLNKMLDQCVRENNEAENYKNGIATCR